MTRSTYYLPFLLGVFGVILANSEFRSLLPAHAEPWKHWTLVSAIALLVGTAFQMFMVGAQGSFARVLPAPGGRSIRGEGAIVGGSALLCGVPLALIAGFLAAQGMTVAASIAGGLGAGALLITLIAYVWCWPAAMRDFGDEDGDSLTR